MSINGGDLAGNGARFSWELRPDGTSTQTVDGPDVPDQQKTSEDVTFSLGDLEEGCFPFSITAVGGKERARLEEYTGSICGDVFTLKREDEFGVHMNMVLRKRH